MKVFAENEKLRVIEGIGHHWNREYQVEKRYPYYNEEINDIDYAWNLVYHSPELEWCMEYFEKHKNDVEKKKKETTEEIEYMLSMWD